MRSKKTFKVIFKIAKLIVVKPTLVWLSISLVPVATIDQNNLIEMKN